MADRLPSGWPLINGVFIEPGQARNVLTLLDAGLRKARADGVRLPEDLSRVIDALNAIARPSDGTTRTNPSPVRWITATVAAKRLGVSSQTVRDMARDGRLMHLRDGRRYFLDEAAVAVMVSYRADMQSHANPPQPLPKAG